MMKVFALFASQIEHRWETECRRLLFLQVCGPLDEDQRAFCFCLMLPRISSHFPQFGQTLGRTASHPRSTTKYSILFSYLPVRIAVAWTVGRGANNHIIDVQVGQGEIHSRQQYPSHPTLTVQLPSLHHGILRSFNTPGPQSEAKARSRWYLYVL